MKSNVQDKTLPVNVQEIDSNLKNLEELLKNMIRISIKEINKDSTIEKEIISLWASYANNIGDYFFEECERNGNKVLYKDIVKYMMFKR